MWYAAGSLGNDLNFATTTVGARSIFGGKLRSDVIAMREKQRGMLMYSLGHDKKRADENRGLFRDLIKETKATIVEIRPLLITETGKASDCGDRYGHRPVLSVI